MLPLLVMGGTGCNLLGCDWSSALHIRVHRMNQITEPMQGIREALARLLDSCKEDIPGWCTWIGRMVYQHQKLRLQIGSA